MYGPNAYKPQQGTKWKQRDEITEEKVDSLKTQSEWPARNAKEFDRLNRYMERFEGAFINHLNAMIKVDVILSYFYSLLFVYWRCFSIERVFVCDVPLGAAMSSNWGRLFIISGSCLRLRSSEEREQWTLMFSFTKFIRNTPSPLTSFFLRFQMFWMLMRMANLPKHSSSFVRW